MNKQKHIIAVINTRGRKKYRCQICQLEWNSRPVSSCPGVTAFTSRDPAICPGKYKTLVELAALNLSPKDIYSPSAVFWPVRQRPWEPLYDENEAIRKNPKGVILPLLKRWFQFIGWLANIIVVGIISILLGLNAAPASFSDIPIINFVSHYQVACLIIGGGIVLFTFIASLFTWQQTRQPFMNLLGLPLYPTNLISITSTISFLVCFLLLLILLFQPSWCPMSLCTSPPTIMITQPQGVHDANLDMYFINLQNTSFVIPGDPASYAQNNLPEGIGAVDLGKQDTSFYRVIIGIHSLQRGKYGIVVERVSLVIDQIYLLPQSLNVWLKSSPVDYHTNPYRVTYNQQIKEQELRASYVPVPYANVLLSPGEADQLDIQVLSRVPVDFQFHVALTYRVANEASLHKLDLPHAFRVAFSAAPNWHEYLLMKGHFVANQ
jgi:hypothetical protein